MRPIGHHAKSVKQNNLSLARYVLKTTGKLDEFLLGYLGDYLPVCQRQSEDMFAKTCYLWQGTLEELALAKEVSTETLVKAWVLVATPNKPEPPKELLPQPEPAEPPKDYDLFLGDVDMDSLKPLEAKKASDAAPELELDIVHDTYDTFKSVFDQWPYIKTFDHKLYGKVLAVGQVSGKNSHEQWVYKGCRLGDDSFGKIGAITEFERKGLKDATFKIKILKVRPAVAKFWVNVDDESRPKGQRDIEAFYRFVEVSPSFGLREIDNVTYSAIKNALVMGPTLN